MVYRSIMSKKQLTPFEPTHPGEMIKDELQERGITQKQLAAQTGIKPSVISETINGKRNISLHMAVALEKALGIPADIWMNMQTNYDLDSANIAARNNQRETIPVTIPIQDRNLLRELARKFGWACVL
jgi:addiction module HigA family antidote